jgi:alpha-tubulin suppressor-like RCC1 family protein
MRTQLVRIAIVALAALALAACRDDSKTLLAPPSPSDALVSWNPSPFPKIVPPNPEDFVEITAGDFHTCARKNNGNVYCWGMYGGDRYIQGASKILRPTLVASGAKAITAGAAHTCMLNLSGLASCWGNGDVGQLGLQSGYSYGQITGGPVAAPPGASTPLTFIAIDAGGWSTCGVTTTQLFCWGELGAVNSSAQWTGSPTLIANYFGASPQLAVGFRHACITSDSFNETDCWGRNDDFQAGVDPAQAMFYPGTQNLIFAQANDLGATKRASADSNFTCADLVNGTVRCFGNNVYGQLGNGTTGASTFHSQLVGNGTLLHGVAAGQRHACALDATEAPTCWGWNSTGQTGRVLSAPVLTPSAVDVSHIPVHTFRALASGQYHSCGIGTDNHIYCWGSNNYAQIGVGYASMNGYYQYAVQALDP